MKNIHIYGLIVYNDVFMNRNVFFLLFRWIHGKKSKTSKVISSEIQLHVASNGFYGGIEEQCRIFYPQNICGIEL